MEFIKDVNRELLESISIVRDKTKGQGSRDKETRSEHEHHEHEHHEGQEVPAERKPQADLR